MSAKRGERAMFLDTLGRGLHAERTGKVGDRLDDRSRAGARHEVGDECTIDLDLIEREALQVAEARIAGADIVERDAHAQRPQRVKQLNHRVGAVEEDRLGDLDFQTIWPKPGPLLELLAPQFVARCLGAGDDAASHTR